MRHAETSIKAGFQQPAAIIILGVPDWRCKVKKFTGAKNTNLPVFISPISICILFISDIMELKRMMEKLGQAKTHLELKKMIAEVDTTNSGPF